MNEVLIIGPTLSSTSCYLHSSLIPNQMNNAVISSTQTGGCFYLATSLSHLGVHTNYVSRFSNDNEAQKLWSILDANNVLVFSSGILNETPKEINIFDQEGNKTSLQQATFDIYPNDPTVIPNLIVNSCDYAFIDIIDSNYLSYLVNKFPHIKWICKNIPTDNLLPNVEGIYLSYKDALEIIEENDFNDLANRLIGKGVKWVIIQKEHEGVYFFNAFASNFYNFEINKKPEYAGLYEFYLSLLLTCLVRNIDIEQSIIYSNEQFVNNITTSANQ